MFALYRYRMMVRKLSASPVTELEEKVGFVLSVLQNKTTHPPPLLPPTIPPYTLDTPPFKLAFESNDDISSSNDDADMEDFIGNTGTGSSHFLQCFWRRQPLFGRLMMVFSLALLIFAILTCCFAICGNSTEGEKKSHLKEVCNSVHMET